LESHLKLLERNSAANESDPIINRPERKYTRITIDETGIELPFVERLLNDGEVVASKKVRVADFQKSMINIADDWMIYEEFMSNDDAANTLIKNIFAYTEEYKTEEGELLINQLLNYVNTAASVDIKAKLLRMLCEKWNLRDLEQNSLIELYRSLVANEANIVDRGIILELIKTLLVKIDFFDNPKADLISTISRVLLESVQAESAKEAIKEVWLNLVSKMSKKDILEAAKPYLAEMGLSTPILPKGCVLFKSNKTQTFIVLEVERQRLDVDLFGEIIPDVGHPKLLFWFVVKTKTGVVEECSVGVIKDVVLNENSSIYKYPFSNVHPDMECCWPKKPKVKDIRNLETFPTMFLTGERNFHLYKDSVTGLGYRDLLIKLSGHDFDDSLLGQPERKFCELFDSFE
jgi:hypothetical protein